MTREELIDAAVAVVVGKAQRALDEDPSDRSYLANEYTQAYQVAGALQEQGVLSHEHQGSKDWQRRETARKSIDGKAKRLLDEEAAKPDARILRFSTVGDVALPRLDGTRRGLSGNAVGYTTPELYQQALAAVEAADAKRRAEKETMAELLQMASKLGMPTPTDVTTSSVTFDVEGFRLLLSGVGQRAAGR